MRRLLPVCILLMGVHLSTQDMVTLAPSESQPEGTVSDVPTPEKPKIKPTIRALHITSDIKYRYATTLVSSRVVNPSDYAGEAAFSITLPESAFISEFLMEIKGEVYKAYVKRKEEAKAEYDQAVQAGQFAGHVALDARDSNQFTVSVNIEAHGKVTFNLTYEQLLSRNLGVYRNVISINPQQIVSDMSVIVNIEEPTAITTLEVPELQISNEAIQDDTKQSTLAKIEEKSPNHKQVTWAPTPEEQKSQNSTGLSGQFIVKYDVDRQSNAQQILVDEGYFVHFFAPENLPKLKKHVIFVLDYSGSMSGRKLEQLKDAMNKILSDLDPKDYFSIVIFQSYIEAWSPEKVFKTQEFYRPWGQESSTEPPANNILDHEYVVQATSANIDLARHYLSNYTDLGATNIIGGLRTGLELVNIGSEQWINESDPPQPVVVFLTDGQPNVEEYDTDIIINKTTNLNTKECPIFSLAFGYGADFNFLRKLSLSNNGFARNIYEAADASDQLKNFYKTVASPLLSNVTFSYLPGQVDNSSNTKRMFPVFFHGSELVVAGKINKDAVKEKDKIGELKATTANGVELFPIIISNILKPSKPAPLGHLEKAWAYLTIQQLLDKADILDKSEEKNQTKSRALELALKYSFVTPLTSLVVVKPNQTESAVDTTQIKPGSTDSSPLYSSISAAGFAAGGPPGAVYAMSIPQPFQPFSASGGSYPYKSSISVNRRIAHRPYSTVFRTQARTPPFHNLTRLQQPTASMKQSTTHIVPSSQPIPVDDLDSSTFSGSQEQPTAIKVTMDQIKWLQQLLANSSSSDATVNIQGHQYRLGINETDQSFGNCTVNNNSGECRHFKHCPLNTFQENVTDFIPYQCPIDGDYLGVCCPVNVG